MYLFYFFKFCPFLDLCPLKKTFGAYKIAPSISLSVSVLVLLVRPSLKIHVSAIGQKKKTCFRSSQKKKKKKKKNGVGRSEKLLLYIFIYFLDKFHMIARFSTCLLSLTQ